MRREPVLRRLSARIDKYDYKLDMDDRLLVIKIHGSREVGLRLLVLDERIEEFRDWINC